MVPGIDGAGTVLASRHPAWKAGRPGACSTAGASGETHWGCLAERARLKGDWLVPLPAAFTARQAMAIGTAGYTAMLCVLALERHGADARRGRGARHRRRRRRRQRGDRAAVAARLPGGRLDRQAAEADYLKALGAAEVIDRAELSAPGKPLQKERWAGVVDRVGSHTLANACAQTRYGGAVAACGLAQGMDLPASVAPFILRGVTLVGVDSVMAPLRAAASRPGSGWPAISTRPGSPR